MTKTKAIVGAVIFDGETSHQQSALLVEDRKIQGIITLENVKSDYEIVRVDGGTLIPGFIDLQVNGGGGVLFNDALNVEGIRTICSSHAKFGTTALLPTLITDTPENTIKAIEAGVEAHKQKVPGFLGLHLEGPHLSLERKGAHDPSLIRSMDNKDLNILLEASRAVPNLMLTVAFESVSLEQISALTAAGILVSLGHTNCTHDEAVLATNAGARCATHLYNAMSPLSHREPGLVGAVINSKLLFCGLIADGHHVDPTAMKIALAAKRTPGKIFLVTDAMSTIGTEIKSFTLNGRTIHRENGVLTLEDGTLAGADLDMFSAVSHIQSLAGVSFEEAVRMASLYPAQCLGITQTHGHLSKGADANFVHISDNQLIENAWLEGDL